MMGTAAGKIAIGVAAVASVAAIFVMSRETIPPATRVQSRSVTTQSGDDQPTLSVRPKSHTIGSGISCIAEKIGGAKQLFIDDHIIASLGGAQRVFKQGRKAGPYLSASTAWERKRSLAYPTVRREGADSWKMWYRAGTPAGERAICYATSTDGINWTKPNLGIYPHNGGRNNIVLIGSGTHVDTPSIFKEGGNYYLYLSEGDLRYRMYESADGIHDWTRIPNGLHLDHSRVLASGIVAPRKQYDICLGVYDKYKNDYIFNFKISYGQRLFGPNDWQRKFHQHRYTGRLANIKNTPIPYMVPRHELGEAADLPLEPGSLRCENYGTGMYPQEDGSVIGFSWLFSIDGHNGRVSAGGNGRSDGFWHFGPINVMLVYTRNINGAWQRPTRTPIVPRSGIAGSWDSGMVHTANAPIEVPQAETFGASTDQVWLYIGGSNHSHNKNPPTGERDHRFGIAKWRMDGFAALEDTDNREDIIITKAIHFSGNQLTLNAEVNSGGYIRVKIKPASGGTDLKGLSDSVTGDNQKHIVKWSGNDNIANCASQDVVLEIRIKNAALYSLDFTTDATGS